MDVLLQRSAGLTGTYGRQPVVAALRASLDRRRDLVLEGSRVEQVLPAGQDSPAEPEASRIVTEAAAALERERPRPPRRVINATGVIVHTNLGRAPLSDAAVQAVVAASGYCDLEYDLEHGQRGSRGASVDPLLAAVCGAPAATAVNNAASALVLVLTALGSGRGVAVSRGELIEIGGSFRLPDIMAAAGARLVEVGTTNRTRAGDYRTAEDIGLLLRMHPSNYRIVGFTEAPSVGELADIAAERGVPLVYDVGSGLVADRTEPWVGDEPSMRSALAQGADLVIASGDKLLGGPQAGLIAGREDLVAACRRHPLARALRLDKLRVAALVATLDAHARGHADAEVPVWSMLTADPDDLTRRSRALAARARGAVVEQGTSVPGGGSAPGVGIPGPVVRLPAAEPGTAAARLRGGEPPVVVRVDAGDLVIDLRTVPTADDPVVHEAVSGLLDAPSGLSD
jgi:L-seryl-tRNA(Ser) seleniumtransferase